MTHDAEIPPSSVAAEPFLFEQGKSEYSGRLGWGCDYAGAAVVGG